MSRVAFNSLHKSYGTSPAKNSIGLLFLSSRSLKQRSNLVLRVNAQRDILQLGDLRVSLAEHRDTSSIYRPTSSENTLRLSGAAFERGMESIYFHQLFNHGTSRASRTVPCQRSLPHCLEAVGLGRVSPGNLTTLIACHIPATTYSSGWRRPCRRGYFAGFCREGQMEHASPMIK